MERKVNPNLPGQEQTGTPGLLPSSLKVENETIRIGWNHDPSISELSKFDLNNPTTCTNQARDFGNLAPLCISFKPNQHEYIWERLDKGWVLRFHKPTQ